MPHEAQCIRRDGFSNDVTDNMKNKLCLRTILTNLTSLDRKLKSGYFRKQQIFILFCFSCIVEPSRSIGWEMKNEISQKKKMKQKESVLAWENRWGSIYYELYYLLDKKLKTLDNTNLDYFRSRSFILTAHSHRQEHILNENQCCQFFLYFLHFLRFMREKSFVKVRK